MKELTHAHYYPLTIFVDEFVPQIIDILCCKIKELDQKVERQKDEIVKSLELMEGAMKLGHEWLVSGVIERGVNKIW